MPLCLLRLLRHELPASLLRTLSRPLAMTSLCPALEYPAFPSLISTTPGVPALVISAMPCPVCTSSLTLRPFCYTESKLNPVHDFKAHTQGTWASLSLLLLSATACPPLTPTPPEGVRGTVVAQGSCGRCRGPSMASLVSDYPVSA